MKQTPPSPRDTRDTSRDTNGMPGDGLTDEERLLYEELLREAYPAPRRDIRAGVMEAIRAERAGQKAAAVLPSPAVPASGRKPSLRTRVLRWGSLAAGLLLAVGAGVQILPGLSAGQALPDNGAGEPELALAADMAAETEARYTVPGLYKSMSFSVHASGTAIEDEEEAEDVFNDSDAGASAEEAAPALQAELPPAMQALVPVLDCPHDGVFNDCYHELPAVLIAEAGEAAYYTWANAVTLEDPCGANIHTFIEHFALPRETLEACLFGSDSFYLCDYPLDLLYEGTEEEIEAYYTAGGAAEAKKADYFEYRFKLALVAEIGVNAYTPWLRTFPEPTVCAWSIARMVQEHGISEERFQTVYRNTVSLLEQEGVSVCPPVYNLDAIYDPDTPAVRDARFPDGYAADLSCRE